ncbi:hypothetical protein [Krasilnikoviella flava]|uniref:Uncharacterized protein n=1 Tax=Krasilnikoviella flava TaxID=526729 RepID=A0A1T5JL75_9MICO|nr:hypothetical protein [Krasilnikoviella flava]SKC52200.1 hypothetical protein SAMN04324258_1514 [Krasilnikoviella flava]
MTSTGGVRTSGAWSGDRIGRLSLRLDAVYCAALGIVAAAAAATFSVFGATALVVVSLLAIAADVGLFAASQGLALRRLAS